MWKLDLKLKKQRQSQEGVLGVQFFKLGKKEALFVFVWSGSDMEEPSGEGWFRSRKCASRVSLTKIIGSESFFFLKTQKLEVFSSPVPLLSEGIAQDSIMGFGVLNQLVKSGTIGIQVLLYSQPRKLINSWD